MIQLINTKETKKNKQNKMMLSKYTC